MVVLSPEKSVPKYLNHWVEENLNPNSYDLRVGSVFELHGGISFYADGRRELPEYRELKPENGGFTLKKGHVYQIETIETISLGRSACAISIMRSSMHKSGASGEVGLYDSGYSGNCGMTVSVHADSYIERGVSVFQLVFLESDSAFLYNGIYKGREWLEAQVTES